MSPRILPILLLCALLAGCTSAPEKPASQATTASPSEAPVDLETRLPEIAQPAVAHCRITRTAANTPFGFGINFDAALYDDVQFCEFSQANATPESFQAALIEVFWTAFQSSEAEMHVRLDSRLCGFTIPLPTMECNQGHAVGMTSPLRLQVDAATLAENAGQDLVAYPWATGLSLEHDLDIYITLFPTPDIPGQYSAVA